MLRKIKNYFSLVKFSHTVFALPFALIGFFMAIYIEDKSVTLLLFICVLLCMITARNTAMAFNRLVDAEFDKKNIRTQNREIPAGILYRKNVLIFIGINMFIFVVSTYFINTLCFYLSPLTLLVIMGYSLTKRFSFLCHIILGIGLGLAPVGAFIAVTSYFTLYIILLGLGVVFWVSGFDIIYALQDYEFDKQHKLFSIPVWLGVKRALILSRLFHILVIVLMIAVYLLTQQNILFTCGIILFALFLIRQHRSININQIDKIEMSFFQNNGIASLLFAVFVILDLFFFKR